MSLKNVRSLVWCSLLLTVPLQAQEICDNGVDDDGDGLVDLNDVVACTCSAVPEATDSLIPNPTFEVVDCDPAFFEQFACAHDWYSGSGSTPDFLQFGNFNIPWIPAPAAGIGYVGGYVSQEDPEYPGTCLLQPLVDGTDYTFRMHIAGRSRVNQFVYAPVLPPVDITLWGLAACPAWPPGPTSACPGNFGWTALATAPYVPDTVWGQISMSFTAPFAVQAIMIGAPCDPPAEYSVDSGNSPYTIYDDLELFASSSLSGTLARTGGWCTDDLVLHASSDTSAATFQWYLNGVALVGNTDSLLHVSEDGLDTGTYQVRISLGSLCLTRAIAIGPDVLPEIHFTATPVTGCAPVVVTFNNTSTADTLSSVRWDFGDGSTSTTLSPVHTYTTPGTYDVSLRVNGSNGCVADSTVLELVQVDSVPQAGFTFGPQPTDVFSTEQSFVDASSADVMSWAWTFASGAPSTDTVPDPIVRFPGNEAGSYPVQLVVANSYGCTDTARAVVTIEGSFSIYTPNAFTPNGDGINEGWRPIWKDLDPTTYLLRIFDRWGEEVWASTDAYMAWDGSVSGQAAMNDVYVWKLEARDTVERMRHRLFGHVTVLR